MARTYYTLAAIDKSNPQHGWNAQFGDYDKEVVKEEMAEYKESGEWAKLKIVAHAPKEQAAAIAALNK